MQLVFVFEGHWHTSDISKRMNRSNLDSLILTSQVIIYNKLILHMGHSHL